MGIYMDIKTGVWAMLGICLLVLSIGVLRRKAEILLNFCVRTILGIVAFYTMNMMLNGLGIESAVGLNPISVLTVGSLGTGGFALLYGISFYHLL